MPGVKTVAPLRARIAVLPEATRVGVLSAHFFRRPVLRGRQLGATRGHSLRTLPIVDATVAGVPVKHQHPVNFNQLGSAILK